MSEVQVFSPRWMISWFLKSVATQDNQVKHFFLELYNLRTQYYFYFQFNIIFLKFWILLRKTQFLAKYFT